MARALAFLICALLLAGCGGGDGDADEASASVEAFPDVLEVARSGLPENAPLASVSVSRTQIAFVNVELGGSTEIRYDLNGVALGNRRRTKPVKLDRLFSIEVVPADAPARILSAIQERERGDVEGFEATLEAKSPGRPTWQASATVGGAAKRYRAALDGTLQQ